MILSTYIMLTSAVTLGAAALVMFSLEARCASLEKRVAEALAGEDTAMRALRIMRGSLDLAELEVTDLKTRLDELRRRTHIAGCECDSCVGDGDY